MRSNSQVIRAPLHADLIGWRAGSASSAGRSDRLHPPAADREQAHDHEQQRALDHVAHLRRDVQRALRGVRAHVEVAQQQRGDEHAGHRQAAEHRDHDARVAEARRQPRGQAALDPGHLAHARDARDGAAHERHAQQRALHADAREPRRVRGEARPRAGAGPWRSATARTTR